MPQSLSLVRRERADLIAAPISAFESETQAVIQRVSPYSEHAILHVLAGIIVLSLILMSVVKLDRVVSATGRIMPTQGSLFVQPLDKAIVTNILVHNGDVVKKGQVLAQLDPTFALADLRGLQQKKASDDALVDRLKAEQAGRPYAADPNSPYSVLQASIWAQRQSQYLQSINDFDSRMASDHSLIARSRQDAVDYQQRLALASQAEQDHLDLKRQGFGSSLGLITASDNRAEMQRMAGDEPEHRRVQGQHDLSALGAQRAVFIGKWRDDLGTQLVTAQNDLSDATQSLAKAAKISDLSALVAPQDAVVLKVGKASIGSVIDPTAMPEPLFTLTPLGGPLEAEVQIDAKDIGFIRPGDAVRFKLDAYRYTSHGLAKGVIKSISEGSFTTTDDGQIVEPYYKVRVAITDARLRNVPADFRLIPGMTLAGDILVGRRTIMSYLVEGGLRTGSEAMREPAERDPGPMSERGSYRDSPGRTGGRSRRRAEAEDERENFVKSAGLWRDLAESGDPDAC